MIPKGRPDKDGYQRFSYPKSGTYMAIDRATGKRVKPKTPASITIPLDAGSDKPAVKHLQKYAYGTNEYATHYGMRSLVESSHKILKDPRREDLSNTSKRSGRGLAFHYLAATLTAVSSNLRRIFRFFEETAKRALGGKIPRTRKRKTGNDIPLAKTNTTQPSSAPPD